MSKLFKSVGKVFKKAASTVTKTVKKVVKSKVFKVAAGAALVYFGGAALTSLTSGGTATAGLSSAWSGLSQAGSQLMAGNLSGAGSALKAGFTGGGAATSGVASSLSTAPSMATGLYNPALSAEAAAIAGNAAPAATSLAPSIAPAATSTGLFGLGEAGTAALVSGGIQTAGSMIAGAGQDKAEQEARDRLTYGGISGDGKGAGLNVSGLYAPAQLTPQFQPTRIDDLIKQMGTYQNG